MVKNICVTFTLGVPEKDLGISLILNVVFQYHKNDKLRYHAFVFWILDKIILLRKHRSPLLTH